MQKEIVDIQSMEYVKNLKKQLFNNEISKYDIAHKMFRRDNADWIITSVNKAKLKITYLNGDVRTLPTYNALVKRIKWSGAEFYKRKRRQYNQGCKLKAKLKTNTLGSVFNNLKINVVKPQ